MLSAWFCAPDSKVLTLATSESENKGWLLRSRFKSEQLLSQGQLNFVLTARFCALNSNMLMSVTAESGYHSISYWLLDFMLKTCWCQQLLCQRIVFTAWFYAPDLNVLTLATSESGDCVDSSISFWLLDFKLPIQKSATTESGAAWFCVHSSILCSWSQTCWHGQLLSQVIYRLTAAHVSNWWVRELHLLLDFVFNFVPLIQMWWHQQLLSHVYC